MSDSRTLNMNEQRFYFLKFPDDDIADYWTSGNNPTGEKCVAVYFGDAKAQEIREKTVADKLELGQRRGGLNTFFTACELAPGQTAFVVFQDEHVRFLKPKSEVQDLSDAWRNEYNKRWTRQAQVDGKEQYPKVCYTIEMKHLVRWQLPYVLATSDADQSLNRVTCRQYSKPCHLNALKRVFGQALPRPNDARSLLENLGPIELETLVFLIFHHRGLFCPANRGSTIKNVDILVYHWDRPSGDFPGLGPVRFNEQATMFQVKHGSASVPKNIDYLVTLHGPSDPKVLDGEWLMRATTTNDDCFQWLKNALSWTGWSGAVWDEV